MTKSIKSDSTILAAHFVIFLAGFTFLLYEVSWQRLLSLVLGTTVTASTIVLASFMAGFGAGAYVWGRVANQTLKNGKLLAVLLAGIGVFSLLSYYLIIYTVENLYIALPDAGLSDGLTEVLVFGVAACIMFVPAFLMGGLFPLLSKIVIKSETSIAPSLGRLYAIETLGSTAGGLITGFVLLGSLGQRNTILLAVAINLALAVWVLVARTFNPSDSSMSSERLNDDARKSTAVTNLLSDLPHHSAALKRTALIAAMTCGFVILGLQVAWLRMFRIYLTNTSYTFALISSVAIFGLFAGSAFFKRWSPGLHNYQRSMLRVIMMMLFTTGLGLLLLIFLPDVLMFPFQAALGNPVTRVLLLPLVASILVVFPPAVFSGYAFPLACRMYVCNNRNISRDVGIVLMVNTLGSVIGPIAVAFVFLPVLGASISVMLLMAVLAAAAVYVLKSMKSIPQYRLVNGVLYGILIALVATTFYRPEIRILPPSFSRFDREILFYRESVEGTLSVGRDRDLRTSTKYTFVNNSAVIGSTYDAIKVVKMVGHFPFFLGLECRDVLVIGFGIGVTTSAIAAHLEVESIECVELVPGLTEAAGYYQDLNHNVVDDPRLRVIAGDGRHYLKRTSKTYDLISCDPTHPILGSGNLYTREYFALCKEHLNPGGMVSQYLPLHKLRTEELMGIISTFHSEFPNCTVWLGHYHAVLLGSLDPIHIEFDRWSERVGAIGDDAHFYTDPYHLAATLILDGNAIAKLTTESEINSDDRSYTEFFAPACLDADNIYKNLRFLTQNRIGIGSVFGGITEPDKMDRFLAGNQLLSESLYYKLSGDLTRSTQLLRQAVRENPENQEFPFLLKLYR